jgi:HK97 gp10 family phage protein
MAKVDIKMPDEFLEKISRLGKDFDAVAESVLEAGGEVVLEKAKGNLSGVVGRGTKHPSRSTGELEASIGLSKARVNREGNHDIKVGFSEPRSDGESNAKLAMLLEYGKHGQPAKPFMKPAKTASKAAAIAAMQRKFEEEVDKR